MSNQKTAISLFSSSGIGDIALSRSGYKVLVANELIPERCSMFTRNFPDTRMVEGGIEEKKHEIIATANNMTSGKPIDLALVTPPCQGMSKNGRGKLLSEIRAGRRPKVDPRNLLILPALDIVESLQPMTIVFENVSEMRETVIPFGGDLIGIVPLIKKRLKNYVVEEKVLEFADFGIPQRRKRLITICSRKDELIRHWENLGTLFPETTHIAKHHHSKNRWVTVRDTIGSLEKLDGISKLASKTDPLHFVSGLDKKKYWWVSNTPELKSAFDNQCAECGCGDNPKHSSKQDATGVNRAVTSTPIYCKECGSLLPRPTTEKNGEIRLMKGFTSAYKRMAWDEPSPAITRNFSYVCSDNKVHPDQHRALSIREACLLHTISEQDFVFASRDNTKASLKTIRDTLGESIPPKALEIIFTHLDSICRGEIENTLISQKSLIFS